MAISTTLPINLSTVITELGLSAPQSILTCKAAVNTCGIDYTYWTNNGNSLTDWRGYTHAGLSATGSISPTGGTILNQAGGTLAITLTVTAGREWTITDDQTWASLSPSSGTGNGSTTLTYSANTNPGSRSVRVSLRRSCDSSLLDTELYTQPGTA